MTSQAKIIFAQNNVFEENEEDEEEYSDFQEEELPLGDLYFSLKNHINNNNLPFGDILFLEEITNYVNSKLG